MPCPRPLAILAAALCASFAARAAEVTEVADAMEDKHPVEIDLDVSYRHLRRDTKSPART